MPELFRQITPYLPELLTKNWIFFLFSIVRHTSTQRKTPAPRGIASQHLWTFERDLVSVPILHTSNGLSINVTIYFYPSFLTSWFSMSGSLWCASPHNHQCYGYNLSKQRSVQPTVKNKYYFNIVVWIFATQI